MTFAHEISGAAYRTPQAKTLTPSRLLEIIGRPICLASRIIANRRDLAALGAMDDHELRDIGLVRSDLTEVGETADDPLTRLARIAHDRQEIYHKTN